MNLDLDRHPVMHALVAPVQRIYAQLSGGWAGRLAAGIAATLQALWHDAFVIFAFLALISAVVDTLYGRRLHSILGDYDPIKAQIGLHGKMAGLTMAWIIRAMEWGFDNRIIQANDALSWASTHGLFATAMVATLLIQDLSSIQEKRERFGQKPIPVFSAFVKKVNAWMDRLAGIPKDAEVRNRRKGDPETNP